MPFWNVFPAFCLFKWVSTISSFRLGKHPPHIKWPYYFCFVCYILCLVECESCNTQAQNNLLPVSVPLRRVSDCRLRPRSWIRPVEIRNGRKRTLRQPKSGTAYLGCSEPGGVAFLSRPWTRTPVASWTQEEPCWQDLGFNPAWLRGNLIGSNKNRIIG